jgi:hypothetical protein
VSSYIAASAVTDDEQPRRHRVMTSDEAATFWQELQRALRQVQYVRRPPDWRGRRTGEWRITQTERREMQALHLLKGENYSALAKRFRRHEDYLSRVIWEPRYSAFHAHYWGTDADTPSLRDAAESCSRRCSSFRRVSQGRSFGQSMRR